jgi:hypothetical protein
MKSMHAGMKLSSQASRTMLGMQAASITNASINSEVLFEERLIVRMVILSVVTYD